MHSSLCQRHRRFVCRAFDSWVVPRCLVEVTLLACAPDSARFGDVGEDRRERLVELVVTCGAVQWTAAVRDQQPRTCDCTRRGSAFGILQCLSDFEEQVDLRAKLQSVQDWRRRVGADASLSWAIERRVRPMALRSGPVSSSTRQPNADGLGERAAASQVSACSRCCSRAEQTASARLSAAAIRTLVKPMRNGVGSATTFPMARLSAAAAV
jgi:hypothetical protein